MSVLLILLKVIGCVLLVLLGLLIVVLFLPFGVYAVYEQGRTTVKLHILGLRFWLFDSEKKSKETAEEAKPKSNEPKEKKPKKKFDLSAISALVRPAAGAAGFILRRIRLSKLCVRFAVGGKDAAEVGINTGRSWEAVGGVLTLLRQVWPNIGVEELTVIPDFLNEHKGKERFAAKVKAMPIVLAAAAVIFLVRYKRYQKQQSVKVVSADTVKVKESAENECKSA